MANCQFQEGSQGGRRPVEDPKENACDRAGGRPGTELLVSGRKEENRLEEKKRKTRGQLSSPESPLVARRVESDGHRGGM